MAHRVASAGDWRARCGSRSHFDSEVVVCAIRYTLSLCICLYSSLVCDVTHLLSCIHCVIEFTLPPAGFSFFVLILILIRSISLLQILVIGLFLPSYLLLLVDGHSLSKSARLPLFLFSCFTDPSSLILVFASSRTVSVKQYAR